MKSKRNTNSLSAISWDVVEQNSVGFCSSSNDNILPPLLINQDENHEEQNYDAGSTENNENNNKENNTIDHHSDDSSTAATTANFTCANRIVVTECADETGKLLVSEEKAASNVTMKDTDLAQLQQPDVNSKNCVYNSKDTGKSGGDEVDTSIVETKFNMQCPNSITSYCPEMSIDRVQFPVLNVTPSTGLSDSLQSSTFGPDDSGTQKFDITSNPEPRRQIEIREPGELGIVVQQVGFCAQVSYLDESGLGKRYGVRTGDIFHNHEEPFEPLLYETVINDILLNKESANRNSDPIRFCVVQCENILIPTPRVTPGASAMKHLATNSSKRIGVVFGNNGYFNEENALLEADVSPIKIDQNVLYHCGPKTGEKTCSSHGKAVTKRRGNSVVKKRKTNPGPSYPKHDSLYGKSKIFVSSGHDSNYFYHTNYLHQPPPPPFSGVPSYPYYSNPAHRDGKVRDHPPLRPFQCPPQYQLYHWNLASSARYFYHPSFSGYPVGAFQFPPQVSKDQCSSSQELGLKDNGKATGRRRRKSSKSDSATNLVVPSFELNQSLGAGDASLEPLPIVVDNEHQKENMDLFRLDHNANGNKYDSITEAGLSVRGASELSPWQKKIAYDYRKTSSSFEDRIEYNYTNNYYPSAVLPRRHDMNGPETDLIFSGNTFRWDSDEIGTCTNYQASNSGPMMTVKSNTTSFAAQSLDFPVVEKINMTDDEKIIAV